MRVNRHRVRPRPARPVEAPHRAAQRDRRAPEVEELYAARSTTTSAASPTPNPTRSPCANTSDWRGNLTLAQAHSLHQA